MEQMNDTPDQMLHNHRQLDGLLVKRPHLSAVKVKSRDAVGFTAEVNGRTERFDYPFNARAFDEVMDTESHRREKAKLLNRSIRESLGGGAPASLEELGEGLKAQALELFPDAGLASVEKSSISGSITFKLIPDPKDTWPNGISHNAKRQLYVTIRPQSRYGGPEEPHRVESILNTGMPKLIARTGSLTALAAYLSRYLQKAKAVG